MKNLFRPTTFLMLLFVILSCGKDDGPKDKEKPRTNLSCVTSYKQGETIRVNEGVTDNIALKSVVFSLKYMGEGEGWEPTETIKVEGKYYDFDNENVFGESIPYTAAIGDYQLLVSISDVAGNVLSKSFNIRIESGDSSKPTMSLSTPIENAVLYWGESVLVTAAYADDKGLKSASYTISYNGIEASPWSPVAKTTPLDGTEVNLTDEDVFEVEIPFNVATGEYALTVIITDVANNTETITRAFEVASKDVGAPTISLVAPTTNQTYKWKESVFVTGTLEDDLNLKSVTYSLAYNGSGDNPWAPAAVTTNIQGKSVSLDNKEVFGASIPYGVAEGEYILSISLKDETGSVGTKDVVIRIEADDTVAPVIQVTKPEEGAFIRWGERLLLSAEYTDDYALKSVSYSLAYNGTDANEWSPASKTVDLDGKSASTTSLDVYGVDIPNNVATGEYVLTITLKDAADNVSTKAVLFNVKEIDLGAPTIELTAPVANQSYKWKESIKISASIKDDISLAKASFSLAYEGSDSNPWEPATKTLTLTGKTKTLTEESIFGETIPYGAAVGDYMLTIIVEDASGSSRTKKLLIKVAADDTVVPTITITKPTATTSFPWGQKLLVSGKLNDDYNLKSVTYTVAYKGAESNPWKPNAKTVVVSGKEKALSNFDVFGAVIPNNSATGIYTLTIALKDAADNVKTKQVDFKVAATDLGAPSITITKPTVNRVYKWKENLLVSGTLTDDIALKSATYSLSYNGNNSNPWSPSAKTITLTGKSSTLTNEDVFGEAIPYGAAEGEYTLVIIVEDNTGKETTQTVDLLIEADDTVLPTIAITKPTTSTSIPWGQKLLVSGTLSDDYNLKSVSYSVAYKGSGSNPWSPSMSTVTLSGKTKSLSDVDIFGAVIPNNSAIGTYALTVTLTDAADNVKTKQVDFTVAATDLQTPKISITKPIANRVYKWSERLLVSGTLSDDIALKSATYSLSYNGSKSNPWAPSAKTMNLTGKSTTLTNEEVFGEAIPYGAAEEEYTLTVQLQDNTGKKSSTTIDILIESDDTVAPTIVVTKPANGTQFEWGQKVLLSGTLSDDFALGTVTYSVSYKGTGSSPWKPAAKTVTLSGKTKTLSSADIFAASIPNNASVGDYELTISLKDAANNVSSKGIVFSVKAIDLGAPTISLTNPIANKIYKWKDRILVSGSLKDDLNLKSVTYSLAYNGTGSNPWKPAAKTVNLSGTSKTLSNADVFAADIPYGCSDGNYTLSVVLLDAAGTKTTKTVVIKVATNDTVAPTISLSKPTTSTKVAWGQKLLLTGTLSDDYNLKSVVYSIAYKGTGSNAWKPSNKTVSLSGKSKSLSNTDVFGVVVPNNSATGTYTLTLTLTDAANNSKTHSVNFSVEATDIAAPVVKIITPSANQSYNWGDEIRVSGILEDDMNLQKVVYSLIYKGSSSNPWKPSSKTVTISGEEYAISNSNVFGSAIPISSAVGDYTLRTVATDASGKSTTKDVTIKIASGDTQAPVINISKPTNSTIYELGDKLQITGTYSDDIALKSVEYKVTISGSNSLAPWFPTASNPLSGKTMTLNNKDINISGIPNTATPGYYTLTVTLTDAAGNTSNKAVNFVVEAADISAPTMNITAPTNNLVIGRNTDLVLSGTFTDDKGLSRIEVELIPVWSSVGNGLQVWTPDRAIIPINGTSATLSRELIFNEALPPPLKCASAGYMLVVHVFDLVGKLTSEGFEVEVLGQGEAPW